MLKSRVAPRAAWEKENFADRFARKMDFLCTRPVYLTREGGIVWPMHLRAQTEPKPSFDSFASLRPRAAAARSPAIIYLLWSSARTNAANTAQNFLRAKKRDDAYFYLCLLPNNSNKSIRLHPNTHYSFLWYFYHPPFMSCNFFAKGVYRRKVLQKLPSHIRQRIFDYVPGFCLITRSPLIFLLILRLFITSLIKTAEGVFFVRKLFDDFRKRSDTFRASKLYKYFILSYEYFYSYWRLLDQ